MATFSIKAKGVDTVLKAIAEKSARAAQVLNDEMNQFGITTVNDAKNNAPVDEGELRRQISYVKTDLKVTVSVNVDYAAYLEFGTRSFAAAYVNSLPAEWQTFAAQFKGGGGGSFDEFVMRLQRWCRLKLGDEQLAYVVARSIMIKGIRPHPYFVPAVEKNRIELIKTLTALFKKL